MSWNARGTVEGDSTGTVSLEGVTFSPPREPPTKEDDYGNVVLDEDAQQPDDKVANQQFFAESVVRNAFKRGAIEGKYSVSISGHHGEGARPSLSLSFSPID